MTRRHPKGPFVATTIRFAISIMALVATLTLWTSTAGTGTAIPAAAAGTVVRSRPAPLSRPAVLVQLSRPTRESRPATATAAVPTTGKAAVATSVKFYVDPTNEAAQAENELRTSDPAEAGELNKIAIHSTAIWLGEWNTNQTTVVNAVLDAAARQSAIPVFVLYAIPDRDCGSFSRGGYTTDGQYRTFVNQIAAGVEGRTAVFIVEPDALPMEDSCLTVSQQANRDSLIAYASKTLAVNNSSVYLDAGDPGWQTQATMAVRLRAAGVQYDKGFSLNVSSFFTTAAQEAYGNVLSADLGHKHFVIDTSRNGNGPGTTWCNPPGRALGTAPTSVTDDKLVDAYLWIKFPGQSDGSCNGGPSSGAWWTSYAVGIATRTAS
jgi:endoglucanase